MSKSNKNVTKLLFSVIITTILLLAGSCQNWMSSDDFMSKIENEVHDANAAEVKVYVRYANSPAMGTTEPSGNTTMKVDVVSKVTAVTSDDYGFVKWAAFSTNDFATNKNHSNLTFISEEDYNNNIKDKELTSEDIVFSDPTEPVTEVKILKERNDIFLIPIVAARPTYVQSVPASGDYNVVKNTSIRILFSKAIDKATLYDSEGKLNYSITSSAAVLVDDSMDLEAKDITDYFDATLSDSGKMLTLKLKEKKDANGNTTGEIERLLDNRQRITITLQGLCDLDGFSMNGSYTFSFQTGTNTDSLAPMIEVIFGGTGEKCDVFVSYHNVDENGDTVIEGKATDAAKNAPQDINSAEYTDALVAQRVYDKLNLFVKATDVIASGSADINPAKDLSEDNVAFVVIAASLYVDKDGNAVKIDETNSIPKQNFVYISGSMDSTSQMTSLFNDVVPVDKDGNKYAGGTIYTYDVSNLPDGLIKLDLWGIDMTGNSGGLNEPGAQYYSKHDNGYKSIFIVKDTTAPDSATESKKIKSNSTTAPYYWYNSENLGTMQLYDLDGNQIVDRGHIKLRSLVQNLSWNFVVGKVTSAPASTDAGWKFIHDQTTGASIKYTLENAKAPEVDGPVDITLFIRDDLGNVSEPVVLNQVMYDNTKPTVTLLDNYGDFVNENGGKELHSSKEAVIPQILKVSFVEPNENNAGSGIRRLEIHVKKGDSDITVPLDANTFKVKWSAAADATPASAKEITIAADDTASTNNLKVFKVDDSSKITTGTLFIYGLTLGDENGDYTVTVDLFDSAMNKTTATAKTKISRDNTPPVINTVSVQGAVSRTVYGDASQTKTWWMPKDMYEAGALTKVVLKVSATETGSGLEAIQVGNDVEFTSATILKKGDTELVKGTDYKFDETDPSHKIILLNNYNVLLKGTPVEFTLENVKLKTINNDAGNKINVEVKDFVGNDPDSNQIGQTDSYQIVYPDNSTGTLVYADNTPPAIATLHMEDTAHKAGTNPDTIAYTETKDNYTDEQTVILTLKLTAENITKGSGVKTVHLSDNAEFTASTAIYVDTNAAPLTNNVDYTIAGDNKSVTFAKVFTGEETLKFTNVNILSTTEGPQIIKADLTDFVGLKTTASTATNTIVLDKTNPVVSDRAWVTTDSTVTVGTAGDMTINTQSLKIDFTEDTAGVKVIKFNIYHSSNPTNVFDNPFDSVDFYYNDTLLTKGTDYTIATNKQYIILTEPRKTGAFKFTNLKLTNANTQGNYVIDVVLLDAAENRPVDDCKITIAIDKDAPVIKQKLDIPGLIHAIELTTNGGTKVIADDNSGNGTWWLKKEYVGSGTDKAPDAIPLYITVDEKGSGIKVITLGGDATISDSTKLYKIAANGSSTPLTVNTQFAVDPQNKTITIIDPLNSFSDDSDFKIYLENVGFANVDTDAVSRNTITAKVRDVALHESNVESQDEQNIYSDSRLPATPVNFKLLDRAFDASASNPTIAASENYTNDSIVDIEFELDDSEKFGSGYHKFVIAGATFRDDSVITMTTSDGTAQIVCNGQSALTRILSDDKKTLTLKTATQNYVIRQAVKVKITNVQLDSAVSGQEKTVTLTAYDLVGRANTAASDSIFFDDTAPEAARVKVFTANYTNEALPYYQPTINVYPHANGENGTGVIVEGTDYPTFYTATTTFADFSQYKGQVSASESSLVTNTVPYGAVLGIRASDNLSLGGYAGPRAGLPKPMTFLYYIADPDLNKTKAQILAGTNLETDINAARANTTTGNSKTSASLCFPFTTGKYSAVIVDEAGNVSDIFHFAVVQDITKPDVTDMQARVLLQSPEGANIYRNALNAYESKTSTFNYLAAGYGTSATTIRTKKYVTKDPGSTNKYKIILNLGNAYAASTYITKIGGGTPSTEITKYSEFTSTASAVKIEQYAISTWYGAFPTSSSSTYTYQPVPPYATSYPSGEINNASSTSSTLATNARNYFDYPSPSYNSYWHAGSGNSSWHSYSHPEGSDGTKVTDSGNGIVSYIDKNDNLIIEIPNTGFTAPVSVFLRDGCGNMNYVVLGLEGSGSSATVPSFIVDNKLGGVTTTNGRATTLSVMQNPFMSLTQHDTNKTDRRTWTIDSDSNSFYWNFQGGTGDQDSNHGVAEKIGFLKDKKLNATYYNPRLYIDDSTNEIKEYGVTAADKHKWSKLGLSLRWNGMPSGTVLEDVMFTSSDINTAISNTDLADEEHRQYDYTCRALLYCTIDSAEPSYSDIVNSHIEGRTDAKAIVSTDRGFRTEWVGVRAAGTDNTLPILIDYPQPDYDFLVNWTANNSKHEPVPYYIWYIYEDRVGNYELAKVVNSKFTDTPLMDRWLYDGAAPDIRVVGTADDSHPNGKKPNEIGNNKEDVEKLVSANNGYVPYLDTANNRIWVSIDTSRSLRNNNLKKSVTGWGVTNDVADGTDGTSLPKRSYLPFANLTVAKEITGIRAFCWSNSSTPPAYTTIVYYDDDKSQNNSQGDIYDADTYPNGAWFAGTSINKITTDIGWTWSDYTKAPDSYLPVTSSSDTYYGSYTGVKINTVLSDNLITASADSELYLHVMDWLGNIASYRMGSTASELKFRNDTTAPAWRSGNSVTSKPSEYFVNVESGALTVRIAGNGKGSSDPTTGQQTMYIEFPEEYFKDNASADLESGIAGYALNVPNANNTTLNLTLDDITKDDSGNYLAVLKIPYSVYKNWSTTSTDVYFTAFDNVGNNQGDYYCHAMLDTTPPELGSVSIVIKKSSGGNFCDEQNGLGTNANNYSTLDWYRDYVTHAEGEPAPRYYDVADDIPPAQLQTVYISKENIARFHINMVAVPGDLDDIKLYKWNNSTNKWDTIANIGNNITRNSTTVTYRLGDGTDAGGYGILECNTTGVIYQICATDKAGNAACQYFKLILDNQGPSLAVRSDATDPNSTTPIIELGKGSINKITSNGTDTYYYTADSSDKATIKFAMTDAGMKNSKQKFYYSFDNSTWTTINNPNDILTDIDALVASGNLDQIYLKDIFENKSTINVNFKYTYGSNDTTIDIPALTYWNTKPAKPTFKVFANDATILTTDDRSGNDSWSAWNTSLLEDSTDTIAINGKSLKWAKISFTKSDKIIGYLVTDGEGNLIKEADYVEAQQYGQAIYVQNIKGTYLSDEYKTAVGSYSFKTDLKDTFKETLPLLKGNGVNTSYAQAVRKYYAVDVVGNISDPLTLTYTYSNPSHQAIDIHLIRSLDEIEASDVKTTITNAVNNGTLKLAQIADTVVGSTTTRFFSGDYLLLSCTLKEKASDSNNDTPARVELVDIWSGAYPGSAVRGYADGDNIIIYSSNTKNSENRYYCYVAFKVGNDVGPDNNKQWSYDAFDNNDQWGGSQLYLRVYGKATNGNQKGTESDSYLINPPEEIDIRWKRDTSSPVIKDDYIDNSRLKGYKTSGDVTVGYDNETWTNGMTNYYSRGMYIYIPVADITDGFTYNGGGGAIQNGDYVTYSGVSQYKTIVTGGASNVDSGWQNFSTQTISWNGDKACYKIAMPNVETVHSEITLKIRDGVGNETGGIRIGKSNQVDSLWWLVDDLLTHGSASTTVTPPEVTWPNPTDLAGYTFDVTPPVGSIIKSITAKIPGSDTNLVSGVSFNDYKTQPTMNGSNGWINVNGLKVTLNKIAQTWSPQDVVFTINGVAANSTVTKTVTGFVPAKKLNDENVIVTEATWVSGTQSYAITVELKDGDDTVDLAKLSGMTFEAKLDGAENENLSASFSNSKITISGTGIPTEKTWADQVITVSISGENINGTITKTVLTVPKKELTASDVVSISDAAIPEGGSAYQVSINLKEGIPDSAISAVTVTPEGVGVNLSGHTVTLSNIPAATWADQDIILSVNGNVASKKVLTVAAKTLTTSDVTLSTATWSETAESYEITVTRNNGAPVSALTSVSADNGVTAAFNNDKSIVTLTGMTKGWSEKQVKLTFNGNVTPDTVVLTIPAKVLSASDIEVSSATYDATKTSYTLTVEMKNGAPASLLTKITADNNVSAQLSNDKASVTLTSIPAQGWTAKQIKLTANSNIDLGVKLTVPALLIKANNITWGSSPTWNASTSEYSITITMAKGDASTAPSSELIRNQTYKAYINGTYNENITVGLNTSGNKIKIKGDILKTKTWDAQVISISIEGDNIDGTITKDYFTIPAKPLTADDVDSISDASIPEGETDYKVTINLKSGVPDSAITSVSADNSVTTSLDGHTVTLGNIPAATWTAQDITLSVNGNIASKKVLTIAAKEVSASDVGITVTDPSNGTWVNTLTTVKFKVTLSTGLTIKDVSVSDDTVTLSKSGTGNDVVYTLTGKNEAKIPEAIEVNVKTNYNQSNAVSVRVFPPSTNGNRYFGRSAALKGMQEVYTFSDTPSSVAALQTRVIELPSVVQKAWDTFAETKEEAATTTLTPASPVAQPKKTSNKAAKKAAKKVEESVAAAAIEITELPAEALVAPAVEDQVAMLLPKTANEEAVAEPQASVSAGSLEVSVTEAQPAERSNAAIWIILATFCAAIAGLVICLKKKNVEKK